MLCNEILISTKNPFLPSFSVPHLPVHQLRPKRRCFLYSCTAQSRLGKRRQPKSRPISIARLASSTPDPASRHTATQAGAAQASTLLQIHDCVPHDTLQRVSSWPSVLVANQPPAALAAVVRPCVSQWCGCRLLLLPYRLPPFPRRASGTSLRGACQIMRPTLNSFF